LNAMTSQQKAALGDYTVVPAGYGVLARGRTYTSSQAAPCKQNPSLTQAECAVVQVQCQYDVAHNVAIDADKSVSTCAKDQLSVLTSMAKAPAKTTTGTVTPTQISSVNDDCVSKYGKDTAAIKNCVSVAAKQLAAVSAGQTPPKVVDKSKTGKNTQQVVTISADNKG